MEMKLDDGWFASYSCGERMWMSYGTTLFFLGTVAVAAFLFADFVGKKRRGLYVYARDSLRSQNAAVFLDPKARTITVTLFMFYAATILLVALVVPLSRSRSELFATDTSIVETGCLLLTPYREVLDRSLVEIDYHYSRGKNDGDWLELKQKDKRQLNVALHGTPYLRNLMAIAPDAMRDYAEQLRTEGKPAPQS